MTKRSLAGGYAKAVRREAATSPYSSAVSDFQAQNQTSGRALFRVPTNHIALPVEFRALSCWGRIYELRVSLKKPGIVFGHLIVRGRKKDAEQRPEVSVAAPLTSVAGWR